MYAGLSNGYSARYVRAIGAASQFDHIVDALAQLMLSDGFLCINCLLYGRFTDIHYRRLSFRVCFGVFYVSCY